MSGRDAQRGFIYQSIIAMIECLERDDWDEVKLEPDTKLDKVDIQLFKEGTVLSAIQVKSSKNQFERSDVSRWLSEVRNDASGTEEICLYLVGDSYSPACKTFISQNSNEIKIVSFGHLQEICTGKLAQYVKKAGFGSEVRVNDLDLIDDSLFSKIHKTSIDEKRLSRIAFEDAFRRAMPIHGIPKCLTNYVPADPETGLIGRDDIVQELRKMLDDKKCIALVSGLGGIGKTAVMKEVYDIIATDGNDKNLVAWINCGDSLEDDLLALRDPLGVPKSFGREEAYANVINKLQGLDGTLYLFMDDMARMPDNKEMGTLTALRHKVRIMITSRHEIRGIQNKAHKPLTELEESPTIEMFYGYYGRDKERKYETAASIIVESVNRHTLLVELLAKAAKQSFGTLDEFQKKLEKEGFLEVYKLNLDTNHGENMTIEECVKRLYDISVSDLSDEQQRIMRLFTIFTPEKEIYGKIVEWAGLDGNAVNGLVERGWLTRGEEGFVIHQIVKDSLARQMGDKLKIEEYGELLDKVANTDSYMSGNLEFTKIRERLIPAEDVARSLEGRINRLLDSKEYKEIDRSFFLLSSALFNNLGMVHYAQGEYEKAIECYRKSLNIDARVQGTELPVSATTYNNIACVYCDQGKYEKALEYFGKALVLIERILGNNHPYAAGTYNNIAKVYRMQGNYENALKCYGKALIIREQALGEEHPDTATTYNDVALVFQELGGYQNALEYLMKALKICERVHGKKHPYTAMTYDNIAGVYRKLGEYEKALEYYRRARVIRERVLGTGHPDTAMIYNNMAGLYRELGEYEKSLEYYGKALVIREKILGTDHPDTATMYNNIALVYAEQRDYPKALENYGKALVIYERVLGSNHPNTANTYNNIACMYRDQGEYEKALEYYGKALVIRDRVYGTKHLDTATTYNNMALVYYAQGQFEKALENYKKAIAIMECVLGAEHPDTATTYNNVAWVYREQGEYEKALELYEKALPVFIEKLGENHPYTQYTSQSAMIMKRLVMYGISEEQLMEMINQSE